MRKRVPAAYATVEPDGHESCILATRRPWSRQTLVWIAMLDEPLEILGPPELAQMAGGLGVRITEAAANGAAT
jgi:hypothetical protein